MPFLYEPERFHGRGEEDIWLSVPVNPREFNARATQNKIHEIVTAIREGKPIHDRGCTCGLYPLHELIELTVKGQFFADLAGANPHLIADRLTDYFWDRIVDVYNRSNG